MEYFKRENFESKIQFVVPLNMTLNSLASHDLKTAGSLNTLASCIFGYMCNQATLTMNSRTMGWNN